MAEATPSPLLDEHVAAPLTTWQLLESMDFMAIEIQMIVSAIFIIYVGAHASLRRPPSAAPPKPKAKSKGGKPKPESKERFAPGFQASDAIMFPLLAGSVLIGLYYLIKWLQDPAILNKILRWYMSTTGVFSTGLFVGDAIQTLLGFVFPEAWIGSGNSLQTAAAPQKRTPFPGAASELPVSTRTSKFLFKLRHLLIEDWNLEFSALGSSKETVPFKITTLIGVLFGVAVQGAYLYTSNNALANVIGLAVCYMACQFMSVTSFSIGALVLLGLFFYDIIMVFYTPFMVGVATQLDVPIKLTYETARRSSMLGLGDIVIPGIFICLALRFDLWKHYQRQVSLEKTDLETVTEGGETTVRTAYREVKAPFVDPRGQWGNAFWTTSWRDLLSGGKPALTSVSESSFPKPYFRATMAGYLVGMLVTIAILIVFHHGQPALLYLVPGVVGSAYITGLWRREIKDMWKYTENGSLDVEDVVVEVDGQGNKNEDRTEEAGGRRADEKDGGQKGDAYEVLSFSVTVPVEDSGKED